ncbi:MAG: hypothetical protein N4A53_16270 [Pelagimonas sp.]|jgi:hypothetical protein|nr:hypothetical protein [Pelagimonas sp.]
MLSPIHSLPPRFARFCTVLVAGLLTAETAAAGAWPKQKGSGFASVATRFSWPQDIEALKLNPKGEGYHTFYLEYGLTDQITIGLDMGHSVSGASKTLGFARYPLRSKDKGPRISAALGFGKIGGETVMRPALHLGWGLKKGWFTIDTMAEYHFGSGDTDYKLDVTWGRNLKKDRKLILQMQTGQQAGDHGFVRLAPSYVRPMGKRLKVETGVTWGLVGDSSMGIKLGLWTEF